MKNSTTIILAVSSFLLFGMLGFFVTKLARLNSAVARQANIEVQQDVAPALPDTLSVCDSAKVEECDTEVAVDTPIPEEKPQIIKVNKLFKAEFQEILNSGESELGISHDFKERISPNCRFSFVGLDEDEQAPASYNAIIMMVNLGAWTSVTVLSTGYDVSDRMISAKIQVNY